MIITITSIRLRSVWHYFRLTWNGLQITRQLQKQAGFIRMKNTGFGYLHFTASAWENQEAMKTFARSGAHLAAMQQTAALATELRSYTFESDSLPTWQEARQLLAEKGKILTF